MRSFKLTEKYQSTFPNDVRNFLHLKKGDRVTFKIENNEVILDKLSYSDYEYLYLLSNTLNEWSSIEDEEAYNEI